MARAVVVGGGVGGLSAAIRLRSRDHDVTIVERNRIGGKLGSTEIDGFVFDTGPSLLTHPNVFEDLFSAAGRKLSDYATLTRLHNPFRHHFADGSVLDTYDDMHETRAAFADFTNGGAQMWDAMWKHTRRVWDTSERTFFAGPMTSPLSMMKRMQSPLDFAHIDALRTLDSRSRSLFTDVRLQAWLNRYATYSGSSPYSAPATLSCIPYLEQKYGSWHVEGGLGRLATALTELASDIGVDFVDGEVIRITTDARGATGAELSDGGRVDADVVVSNVNAERLYGELLPTPAKLRQTERAGRSSSVFAMLLGLSGRSAGTTHHNLWYSGSQRQEFAEIFDGPGVAGDPTVYVCNPTATDHTVAPADSESWFVLVNVAAGADHDWASYGDAIVDRLGIGSRVKIRRDVTPADLETTFGDPGGAIYGTSSSSKRSAFLRAANRGAIPGLYLCGGSAHPGGGLPLVAMSGRIVADLVEKDLHS